MADELDALLDRISDAALGAELRDQIERLRRRREFGLVFKSHLPERVRLPDHPIRRGSMVVDRNSIRDEAPREVLRVKDGIATLDAEGGAEEVPCDDLVVVAEFGEPVYPGLRRVGSIQRGGDKPAHVVIKGENYHVLEALRFSYAGKVDCIYIDPPYNNRSKDWKYNNDYVDKDDVFKHSKWLAMMHRRLGLAQQLLNPDASALIVTIDENEVHHLALLLEQMFPDADIQMVTTVISAKGAVRPGKFARVEEHIFFVTKGAMQVQRWNHNMLTAPGQDDLEDESQDEDRNDVEPQALRDDLEEESHDEDRSNLEPEVPQPIEWLGLRRREPSSVRGSRPNQFYPIFVNGETGFLHSIGDAMDDDVDRHSIEAPSETVALWPLKPDGTEMLWGLTPEVLRTNWRQGFARVSKWNALKGTGTVKYLPSGTIAKIRDGTITVTGRASDGSVEAFYSPDSEVRVPPKRVWNMASHNAETGGTNLLSKLIPNRRFDYPKSVYAVEDTLRFVVGDVRDAVVLDFFAGSGTTAQALARLNRQDDGCRQSIIVTNNEVSAEDVSRLREAGLRPGDPQWEELGIFEYITRPRITAAVVGRTADGTPLEGEYRFTDEFPMADGFEENIEFLELKYLDIEDVELDAAFGSVASLLWLRAGGVGPVIDQRCDEAGKPKAFDMTERYGVLFDPDHWRVFVDKLPESVVTVFIVTDSPSVFTSVSAELATGLDVVRLYENYLTTFAINRRR